MLLEELTCQISMMLMETVWRDGFKKGMITMLVISVIIEIVRYLLWKKDKEKPIEVSERREPRL